MIILEVAWTSLVAILPKQTSGSGVSLVRVPWFHFPFSLDLRTVSIGALHAAGATTIALFWFLYSGLYLILIMSLWQISKSLLILIIKFSLALAFIFLGPLSYVELVRARRLPGWRFKRVRPAVRLTTRWRDRPKGPRPKGTRRRLSKDDRLTHQIDVFNNLDVVGNRLADVLIESSHATHQWLASFGYIGLASLASVSLQEDEKAAKAAMQNFAQAIARLRMDLRYLPTIPHIRFLTLPPLIRVTSVGRAGFLRRWLGLDAIIYGSYVSLEPPRIWLNLDRRLPKPEYADGLQDHPRRIKPLQAKPGDRFSMVVIDQGDPIDAYLVLLLCVVEVLRVRSSLRSAFIHNTVAQKFPRIYKYLFYWAYDRLSMSLGDRNAIVAHMVEDVLLRISNSELSGGNSLAMVADTRLQPEKTTPTEFYPTTRDVMVDYAMEWVDDQIGEFSFRDSEVRTVLLRDVVHKCLEMYPHDAGLHYRASILSCLHDDLEIAWAELQSGLSVDKDVRWAGPFDMYGEAAVSFSLSEASIEKNLKFARNAILAARAISRLASTRESFLKSVRTSVYYESIQSDSVLFGKSPQASTGERLFFKVLGMDWPGDTQEPTATTDRCD